MIMKRYAKIIRWILGAAALLMAVLLVFILIAPRLINIESIRETLVSTLSQRTGAELKFQKIRLSILPQPHVVVFDGRLSVPDAFQANWKSLSMSARLLPLFIGQIDIGAITVGHPEITITVDQKAAEANDGRQPSISASVADIMKPLAGIATAVEKDLMVIIKEGRLKLQGKDRFELVFSGMDGRLDMSPDRIRISLDTRTDFCEKIELQADTDLESFNSRGRIDLTRIRPQRLPPNLFGAESPWIGESLINLTFDFKTEGFRTIETQVQGSAPQLTIMRGGNPLALNAASFKARFHQDDHQFAVLLTECILEHPKLTLTGKFLRDQDTGQLEMELKAADVEVPSTRQAVMTLAGETEAVQAVFDIVRGGRVPEISGAFRGNSFADLAKLENMTFSGSLREGNIVVPGMGLNVKDVGAEVKILKRVLSVEQIKGRYDDTTILDGSLNLGLWGETAPFHLDIGLNADLTQVPPILKQVVKDIRALEAIERIAVVDGRAEGRLILGDTLADLSTAVKVSDFAFTARVAPIADVLILKGNDLAYSGTALTIGRLEGKLEKSRFLLGPGRMDWRQTPFIEIQAGRADLALNEIHTILSAFTPLKNTLKSIQSLNGTVTLSRFQLSGPPAAPSKWEFRAEGTARNAEVKSEQLPAPLSVRRVEFKATPHVLAVSQAETGMMDAALTVSGRLTDYLGAIQTADLGFEGTVGAKALQWLHQRVKIPPNVTIRPPLQFSKGRVVWQRDGPTAFSGDLKVQNDLNVSADGIFEPDHINIKKLVLRDRDSTAALTISLIRGKKIDFAFKGNLQKTTVDKLLSNNRILEGWIKGDLRLAYAIGRPWDTKFEGMLSAKDLIILERIGIPIKTKTVSIAGIQGKFDINADMLYEQDKELQLTGQVDHSPRGIRFDAAVTAGAILLDDIIQTLAKNDKKEKDASKDRFWEFPVEGMVKFNSAYVSYGKYTWGAVSSTLSLKPEEIVVKIGSAEICGISTPGTITLTPREIRFKFDPIARDQELSASGLCLVGKEAKIEGRYHLAGLLTGQGSRAELMGSLAGSAEMDVENGRFYAGRAYRVLREILAVLNFTEMYRGKLPDIAKEGFGFNFIKARMKIENNVILIEEGIIDGLTMEVAVNGIIKLSDETVNLTLLVAPLKTVDSIVKRIPLVGDILGGSLISVPVGVKGNLKEPKVTILPPAAVGEGLVGILTRTMKLPVKIIELFIPGEKK